MDQLKMYSLLKMGMFHCHVSLLEGNSATWTFFHMFRFISPAWIVSSVFFNKCFVLKFPCFTCRKHHKNTNLPGEDVEKQRSGATGGNKSNQAHLWGVLWPFPFRRNSQVSQCFTSRENDDAEVFGLWGLKKPNPWTKLTKLSFHGSQQETSMIPLMLGPIRVHHCEDLQQSDGK